MQQHVAQLEIDLQRKLEEKAGLEAQYSELERRLQQPHCRAESQVELQINLQILISISPSMLSGIEQ